MDHRVPQTGQGAHHARAMLFSLQWECPLGGNPAHCQLQELRQMSTQQRHRWLSALSDDECSRVYRQHLDCLAETVCPDGCCPQ